MKTVRVHEHGGPEVLRYEDAPDPRPGPGEVLVRVKAVGLNFADYLMRLGAYPNAGPLPLIPGLESAGVVEALGEGVTDLQPGQRVLSWGRRSYAELSTARAWVVITAGQDWKLDRARTLGADATINYTDQDVAEEVQRLTDGAGVHVVL